MINRRQWRASRVSGVGHARLIERFGRFWGALVLIPGVPLGLLTNAVQVLAGILLPSATVFLLLLSNDKPVLGPWANSGRVNIFTGMAIAILVVLSVVLTASTRFSTFGTTQILGRLASGSRDHWASAFGLPWPIPRIVLFAALAARPRVAYHLADLLRRGRRSRDLQSLAVGITQGLIEAHHAASR